jgi:hypothetical protein
MVLKASFPFPWGCPETVFVYPQVLNDTVFPLIPFLLIWTEVSCEKPRFAVMIVIVLAAL